MTDIILKQGTGVPSEDDVEVAEVAIDTSSGAMYTKLADGSVKHLNPEGGGGGDSLWEQSGDDIYYNDGNVGIGTDAPSHPLNVIGNARFQKTGSGGLTVNIQDSTESGTGNSRVGLHLHNTAADMFVGGLPDDNMGGNEPHLNFNASNYTLQTKGADRLTIASNGNVGIGGTPGTGNLASGGTAKLQVAGDTFFKGKTTLGIGASSYSGGELTVVSAQNDASIFAYAASSGIFKVTPMDYGTEITLSHQTANYAGLKAVIKCSAAETIVLKPSLVGIAGTPGSGAGEIGGGTAKLQVAGDGYFSGTVNANKFVGDGSSLTNLPSGASTIEDLTDTDTAAATDAARGIALRWCGKNFTAGGTTSKAGKWAPYIWEAAFEHSGTQYQSDLAFKDIFGGLNIQGSLTANNFKTANVCALFLGDNHVLTSNTNVVGTTKNSNGSVVEHPPIANWAGGSGRGAVAVAACPTGANELYLHGLAGSWGTPGQNVFNVGSRTGSSSISFKGILAMRQSANPDAKTIPARSTPEDKTKRMIVDGVDLKDIPENRKGDWDAYLREVFDAKKLVDLDQSKSDVVWFGLDETGYVCTLTPGCEDFDRVLKSDSAKALTSLLQYSKAEYEPIAGLQAAFTLKGSNFSVDRDKAVEVVKRQIAGIAAVLVKEFEIYDLIAGANKKDQALKLAQSLIAGLPSMTLEQLSTAFNANHFEELMS